MLFPLKVNTLLRLLLCWAVYAFAIDAHAQQQQTPVLKEPAVQQEKKLVYDEKADAAAEVAAAVKKAKAQHKHVLLQIGGNWCIWCLRFHKLVTENDTLRTAMESNFVVVHVNYSKENKNEKLLASLGYPQRFGFPVFVVLDGNGNRLHTQNSGYLEEGKAHSAEKVLEFFNHWSPKALNPASYSKQ